MIEEHHFVDIHVFFLIPTEVAHHSEWNRPTPEVNLSLCPILRNVFFFFRGGDMLQYHLFRAVALVRCFPDPDTFPS